MHTSELHHVAGRPRRAPGHGPWLLQPARGGESQDGWRGSRCSRTPHWAGAKGTGAPRALPRLPRPCQRARTRAARRTRRAHARCRRPHAPWAARSHRRPAQSAPPGPCARRLCASRRRAAALAPRSAGSRRRAARASAESPARRPAARAGPPAVCVGGWVGGWVCGWVGGWVGGCVCVCVWVGGWLGYYACVHDTRSTPRYKWLSDGNAIAVACDAGRRAHAPGQGGRARNGPRDQRPRPRPPPTGPAGMSAFSVSIPAPPPSCPSSWGSSSSWSLSRSRHAVGQQSLRSRTRTATLSDGYRGPWGGCSVARVWPAPVPCGRVHASSR